MDRLVAAEPQSMLGDDLTVLAHDDPLGTGVDLDRPPFADLAAYRGSPEKVARRKHARVAKRIEAERAVPNL